MDKESAAWHGQERPKLRYSVTYVAGQVAHWRLQLAASQAISGTGWV